MHRLSYGHGPGGLSRIYRTIPSLLDQRAAEMPNKPANIFRYGSARDSHSSETERIELTFGEIAERSFNVAGSLLHLGLKKGDKVVVMGSNCPEWLFLEYACFRIGILLVKIPSNFITIGHFSQIIGETKSKIMFVDPDTSLELIQARFPHFLDTENDFNKYGFGQIQHVILLRDNGFHTHDSISKFSRSVPTDDIIQRINEGQAVMSPDDAAILFMTSGSTGIPKPVVHSHYGYTNNMNSPLFNFNQDIIMFNDRPFAWIASIAFLPIISGCTLVHMDPAETFAGDAISKVIEVLGEEKVNCALLLQYLLFDAMKGVADKSIVIPSVLEHVITGAERISQDIIQFGLKTFKTLQLVYGATECAGVGRVEAKTDNDGSINFKWYNIAYYTELKMVDDKRKVVPRGEVGNLLSHRPYSMMGYLIHGELKEKDSDWIDVGDLASMRDDGKFEILGRKSDVISRGGWKVYPKILEDILCEHEKVDKVVVVGVPDPRLFQEACACIIAKPGVILTDAELHQYFSEQIQTNAVSFTPKYYILVDQFPKEATGKVDKLSIAELAIDRFQLHNK